MDTTGQGQSAPGGQALTNEKAPEGQAIGGSVGSASSAEAAGSAVKEAAQEAMRKLKIGDAEVDEAEVIKVYQERKGHQRVANKELQEGRAAKKQAEEFIAMMKDEGKLFEAIRKLGHDPRTLAEKYLAAQLEDEMLDPQAKELKATKAQLRAYEEQQKQVKAEADKKIADEMKRKFSEDYSKQFVEALQATGLPPTKSMVAEMAKYIKRAAEIKFELKPTEAAKLVKEDMENAYRKLYGEADAETLVKLIGETGLQKVRGYDTSRLKDPNANLKTPAEQGESNQRERKQVKRMTPQEWREFNRK